MQILRNIIIIPLFTTKSITEYRNRIVVYQFSRQLQNCNNSKFTQVLEIFEITQDVSLSTNNSFTVCPLHFSSYIIHDKLLTYQDLI